MIYILYPWEVYMQRVVSLNQLIFAFSKVLDLMDTRLYTHHRNVAYIALRIAEKLGMDDDAIQELVLAALIHDIGMFKCSGRKRLLAYNVNERMGHEEIGALLIESNELLRDIADIIRYHHCSAKDKTKSMPESAFIVYLADRISVMINFDLPVSEQIDRIKNTIENDRETRFFGNHMNAFYKVAATDAFWLDMKLGRQNIRIQDSLYKDTLMTNHEDIMKMGNLFIAAVDYRSRYTAAHSVGVSKVARKLSLELGMTEKDADSMEIAGYYHDIGKIAIPKEVLDKPSALSRAERENIRCHSYFTYDILSQVDGLKDLAIIASYHHECLDGTGYPFGKGKQEISLESSIMTIADIFTAITEERPYRKSMEKMRAIDVLKKLMDKGKINSRIGTIAIEIFDVLHHENRVNQKKTYEHFQDFERIVYERTAVNITS